MRGVAAVAGLLMLTACTARHIGVDPRPTGPFRFEGTPTLGEIRVVPILRAFDEPELRTNGYVTADIPDDRLSLRAARMQEVDRVPDALATALPGAIHSRLGEEWSGHFRVGQLPMGARNRIENALRRHDVDDLESALATAAEGVGGQGTLFVWLTDLQADPLTAEGFPGDHIQTSAGPVVVDFFEEPFRIRAELGTALVDNEGHVVLRYVDKSESLISPHRSSARVGRELAADLAEQVAKMWPDDPRLWRNTPPSFAPSDQLVGVKGEVPAPRTAEVPFSGLRQAADER